MARLRRQKLNASKRLLNLVIVSRTKYLVDKVLFAVRHVLQVGRANMGYASEPVLPTSMPVVWINAVRWIGSAVGPPTAISAHRPAPIVATLRFASLYTLSAAMELMVGTVFRQVINAVGPGFAKTQTSVVRTSPAARRRSSAVKEAAATLLGPVVLGQTIIWRVAHRKLQSVVRSLGQTAVAHLVLVARIQAGVVIQRRAKLAVRGLVAHPEQPADQVTGSVNKEQDPSLHRRCAGYDQIVSDTKGGDFFGPNPDDSKDRGGRGGEGDTHV
jgi:hypothetical protein